MAFLTVTSRADKAAPLRYLPAVMACLMAWAGMPVAAWAGPYEPGADETCSHAVSKDDPALVAWATGVVDYLPGPEVDARWQDQSNALGPAEGTSFDIVCLGRGGEITLTFAAPITNGSGWDFAIFENGVKDTFLELAYVEVSSNGVDFVQFDSASLTPGPVPAFGEINPTNVDGLAGKYRQGFGTPFDLEELSGKALVTSGTVDLNAITHVRLADIIGDGSFTDSTGRLIYDPYPTSGSAGFDLDAIGVSNGAAYPTEVCPPPTDPPTQDGEAGVGGGLGCFIQTIVKQESK